MRVMKNQSIKDEDLWKTDAVRLLFKNFIEARRQFLMAQLYYYTRVSGVERFPHKKISRLTTYDNAKNTLSIHLTMHQPVQHVQISDRPYGASMVVPRIDSIAELYNYCRFEEHMIVKREQIKDIIKNKAAKVDDISRISDKDFLYLTHISKSFISLIETHRKLLFYTLTKIHKQTINKDKYSIYNCAERFGYIECADDFMQYNDIRNYVSHPFKHYTELSDPHTFMLSKIENNINDNMDVFTKRWVLSAQKAGADYAHIVHDPYLEIATNQQYDIDCLLHFVLFYTDYLNTKVEKLGLKKNIELMAKLAEYNIISEKTVKNIMDFRHTRNKTAHGDIIICNNTVNIQEIWTTIVQCTMMVELIETNLHLYQSTTNDHSHDYS